MRAWIAVLWLFSTVAVASPFVVADVVSGVTQCGVVVDTQPKVTVPAASLMCKYDVSALATGSHTITMTAITVSDPVWGTQESVPSAPFVFTRPAKPTAPSTLRLAP